MSDEGATGYAYLMTHDTIVATLSSGIPLFQVSVAALAASHASKINMYNDKSPVICLIFSIESTQKKEFLGGRIRDCS
jgi:hypothetical protein